MSWVLPKGTVEPGETHEQTALREVMEEAGVRATIVKYIGKSQYNFTVPEDVVFKEVHWYLMTADNYHSKPQREEFFVDSGYYKFHEIYHLLRFSNEKQIVERAYQEYLEMRSNGLGENSISIINERTGAVFFCNAARFKFWRKWKYCN